MARLSGVTAYTTTSPVTPALVLMHAGAKQGSRTWPPCQTAVLRLLGAWRGSMYIPPLLLCSSSCDDIALCCVRYFGVWCVCHPMWSLRFAVGHVTNCTLLHAPFGPPTVLRAAWCPLVLSVSSTNGMRVHCRPTTRKRVARVVCCSFRCAATSAQLSALANCARARTHTLTHTHTHTQVLVLRRPVATNVFHRSHQSRWQASLPLGHLQRHVVKVHPFRSHSGKQHIEWWWWR
jgi:hypothetical protein